MQSVTKRHLSLPAALLITLLSIAAVRPTVVLASEIALVEDYSGTVSVYVKERDKEEPVVKKGAPLSAGDRVIVAEKGWAQIAYPDGSKVLLKEKTELRMEEEKLVSVDRGRALFRMLFQKVGRFGVRSGNAVIGIKGTTYMVDASDGKTDIYLKEGRIEVSAAEGEFKRYRDDLMEEFRKYREKEERDFEEYKRKMEEEFVEYVKSFELKAGGAVSIDGAEVRNVEIPSMVMEEFRRFEEGLPKVRER